jgi:regulator of sirC expression with transglutaminase-like and TPR domain
MQARVLIHPAVARQRFREIAALPEPHVDLVEASLLIAAEDQPGVDVDRHLREVTAWSEAVSARLRGSHDVARVVEAINRQLFEEEGFHGEDDDYYDPRSALVSEMLDRHAGLPITLSILYLELTRRIGAEATGIALPGRFLVKFTGYFGEVIVDPFDGGRVVTPVELQKILDQLYGGGVRLREHHLRSFSAQGRVHRATRHRARRGVGRPAADSRRARRLRGPRPRRPRHADARLRPRDRVPGALPRPHAARRRPECRTRADRVFAGVDRAKLAKLSPSKKVRARDHRLQHRHPTQREGLPHPDRG